MKVICVDDEAIVLDLIMSMCAEIPFVEEVKGFTDPNDAYDWLRNNTADLALLDIDMPAITGLDLAALIKERRPDISIIFITGYSRYAIDAFSLHVSGYILKPVSYEKLLAEIEYARSRKTETHTSHISAQTFGSFELFVDGKPVVFTRAKSKELLAYLIDRRGAFVTRADAASALWEDEAYDRTKQKYLYAVIRTLKDTLAQYNAESILDIKREMLRIVPEKLECDLYRFLKGDIDAVNAYRGEYMKSYPWAVFTEAKLN